MTDFGFLLLLLGAYLTYRFIVKPRFIDPPKKRSKKVNIEPEKNKKDFDGGEFIDYEEVKE